jgi:hypothetical protein
MQRLQYHLKTINFKLTVLKRFPHNVQAALISPLISTPLSVLTLKASLSDVTGYTKYLVILGPVVPVITVDVIYVQVRCLSNVLLTVFTHKFRKPFGTQLTVLVCCVGPSAKIPAGIVALIANLSVC